MKAKVVLFTILASVLVATLTAAPVRAEQQGSTVKLRKIGLDRLGFAYADFVELELLLLLENTAARDCFLDQRGFAAVNQLP